MVGYDGVTPESRTQPGLFLRVARVAGFSHDWRLLAQRSHANGAFGGTNRGRGRHGKTKKQRRGIKRTLDLDRVSPVESTQTYSAMS